MRKQSKLTSIQLIRTRTKLKQLSMHACMEPAKITSEMMSVISKFSYTCLVTLSSEIYLINFVMRICQR